MINVLKVLLDKIIPVENGSVIVKASLPIGTHGHACDTFGNTFKIKCNHIDMVYSNVAVASCSWLT